MTNHDTHLPLWQRALGQLVLQHPFLPDRTWLQGMDGTRWEALWAEVCEPDFEFTSLRLYWEVLDKPQPCLGFSSREGLVLHALNRVLNDALTPLHAPATHFELSAADAIGDMAGAWRKQYPQAWVVRADVRAFFRSLSHPLLVSVYEAVLPARWYWVLTRYIEALERVQQLQMPHYFKQEHGLPLGLGLNHLLAHHLLLPVDLVVRAEAGTLGYLRYLDDMLVFVEGGESASRILHDVLCRALAKLGLSPNFDKTKISPPGETIEFLGRQLMS